jgi:hypothetical protein
MWTGRVKVVAPLLARAANCSRANSWEDVGLSGFFSLGYTDFAGYSYVRLIWMGQWLSKHRRGGFMDCSLPVYVSYESSFYMQMDAAAFLRLVSFVVVLHGGASW